MSEVKERDKRVRGADNNCDYISFESAPHSHFICEYKKKHVVISLTKDDVTLWFAKQPGIFTSPPKPHHDILLTSSQQLRFFLTAPQRGARQNRVISEIHKLHDVHDTKYGLPPSTSDP